MGRHWAFVADMNADYGVTISDVWLWIKWLYFYPGDMLMYVAMDSMPRLASFFEIGLDSYGGVASGLFSFFAWALIAATFSTIVEDIAKVRSKD
jgi:hypothetical protein